MNVEMLVELKTSFLESIHVGEVTSLNYLEL